MGYDLYIINKMPTYVGWRYRLLRCNASPGSQTLPRHTDIMHEGIFHCSISHLIIILIGIAVFLFKILFVIITVSHEIVHQVVRRLLHWLFSRL